MILIFRPLRKATMRPQVICSGRENAVITRCERSFGWQKDAF